MKIIIVLLLMLNSVSFSSIAYTDSDLHSLGNHSPICIIGNNEFTPENGVTGGNGTPEDPYLIEGWVIIYDGSAQQGIFINNTDAYFIIQNCTVSQFHHYWGIRLSEVVHGTIKNITSIECMIGIAVEKSMDISLMNCTTRDYPFNGGWGICIVHSSLVDVYSSQCFNFETGIFIIESIDITIQGSCCYDNLVWGIVADVEEHRGALNYSIKNCEFWDNHAEGITVFGSAKTSNITVQNCSFHDQGTGIDLQLLTNATIEHCNFENHSMGIFLDRANSNSIRNCSFFRNDWGLQIDGAFLQIIKHNEVSYCTFMENEIGVLLFNSIENTVHHCLIANNSYMGLLTFDTLAHIFQNNIVNNGRNWTNNTDPAGVYSWRSFLDVRQNWWGSSKGPCISLCTRFPIIPLRSVENSDLIMLRYGFARFRPWLSEPVLNAGRPLP